MKTKLLLLLVSVLSLGDVWANEGDVFTAETVEGVELTFKVISEADKTCQVGTGKSGTHIDAKTITIPASANGYSVTSIGDYAFQNCSRLTSINIPSSVTSIGGAAFDECSSLTSITIPESVKRIKWYAFYGCKSLSSITIPSSVTSIENGAFQGSGLTTLTISEGVTSIGTQAFAFCGGLTSINIPSSMTSIVYDSFRGCFSLTSITVDSSNPVYDSRDNCNAFIETSSNTLIFGCQNTIIPSSVTSIGVCAFNECSSLTSITIPSSVTGIGEYAFNGCSSLTSITIPSSVMSIGERAFDNKNLASVTLKGEKPVNITKNVFNDMTYKVARLYVPSTAIQKYENTAVWNEFWFINEGEPGDCNPAYIVVPTNQEWNGYVANYASVFNVRLSNLGTEPVSSVSFYVSVNRVDEEEQTYTLPKPVSGAYNEYDYYTFELPITLSGTYSMGKYDVTYTITKINGVDISYGPDYMTNSCGKLVVFTPVEKHSAFIEEFTSTSCVWALRSKVGIKALENLYGSRIVHMAVHLDEPMWSEPPTYSPFTPTCRINKSREIFDPYYGSSDSTPFGIMDDVEKALNEPSPGSIKILKAAWADPDRTAINVTMETTFGVDDTDVPYVIRFNLLEDKMKGSGSDWIQRNAYAGMTLDDPNLQPLTLLPEEISDMEYDHVAVQHEWFGINPGKSPYRVDTPQQVTHTIKLGKNSIIQDKDNLSVVAFLYEVTSDYWSGKVFDVDKSWITSYEDEIGISSVSAQPASPDIYDIHGHKVRTASSSLDNLPHGIYIVGGKKIVK